MSALGGKADMFSHREMSAYDPQRTFGPQFRLRPADGLLHLDIRRPDYLAPLLGFIGHELCEVSRRAGDHHAAQVCEPRLHLGGRQANVDFMVELVDDRGGSFFGRPKTNPVSRLIAW